MKKHSAAKTYFIIVCWNNRDLLEACFETIYAQTNKNYSIICVDNGSTDDSVCYIKKSHPDVILIENGKNEGFAIGNNIGIKKALNDTDCKYISFLNTDARLDKDWLEILVAFADKHPNGAGFQTPTLDYYDHNVLDSYGIKIDRQGRAMQLGYRLPVSEIGTVKVFGVNAAACLYSRAFLETQPFGNDYFDSDMWMYLEDVDLAARSTIMGWTNWCIDKSAAYHMGSASSSKNPGFSVFMCYRNNIPMAIKNFPLVLVLLLIPGAFYTDLITLLKLARHRNFVPLKAIIKGRLMGVLMIPRFLKKRSLLKASSPALSSRRIWKILGSVNIK